MNYEAYIKLEQAVKNNELSSYLLAKPGYRLTGCDDPNFPMMNDYRSLVVALNDYGKIHSGFDKLLSIAVVECLDLATPGAAYNIMQIIRQQLFLESSQNNSVSFVNKEIYEKLRFAIIKNKEYFERFYEYEGRLFKDGMNGAFKEWSNEIYKRTGNKLL